MRIVLIEVQCPHCESRFRLQAELLGKQLRCNVCREVYTASKFSEPPPPLVDADSNCSSAAGTSRTGSRSDAPEPVYQTGTVGDMVPVLSAEAVPTESSPTVTPLPKEDPRPYLLEPTELLPLPEPERALDSGPTQREPAPVPDPMRNDTERATPPAPREVAWCEDVQAPPAPREQNWSPELSPPVGPVRPQRDDVSPRRLAAPSDDLKA